MWGNRFVGTTLMGVSVERLRGFEGIGRICVQKLRGESCEGRGYESLSFK